MTNVYQRRGFRAIAVLFAVCLVVSMFGFINRGEIVMAEGTTTVQLDDPHGAACVRISVSGYSNETIKVSFSLGSRPSGGYSIWRAGVANPPYAADGIDMGIWTTWTEDSRATALMNDYGIITVTITPNGADFSFIVGINGYGFSYEKNDLIIMNTSIVVITPTPSPSPEPTDPPTPTPKPVATNTATPTPKPEATSTPKPTATPKPAATNTPKPTATPKPAAATATPIPAEDTPTPVPATATPVPAETDPVVVVQTEETTPTPTNTPTPTPEVSETPTPTVLVVAPVIQESQPDETEPEETETVTDTPTPTVKVAVAATTSSKKSNNFPWWIIAVALILLLAGGRYKYLRDRKGFPRKDAVIDIIPGGIVRKVTGMRPYSPTPTVAAGAAVPKVVNGYLQTSNTRSIRPMYSNTPAARAAEAKAMAAPEAAPAPALKAPIERPASASVNHAAAAAAAKAETADKAAVATATSAAPAPGLKPPIKRPASASVNHAAAAAAAKTEPAAKTAHVAPAAAGAAVAAAATTAAASKPAPKTEQKPPLQQRAPIKRPAQYSSNRSAAIEAEKKAVAEAAENASKAAAAAAALAEEKRKAAAAALAAAEAARREAEAAEAAIANGTFDKIEPKPAPVSEPKAEPKPVETKAEAPVQTNQSPFARHGDSPFAKKSAASVDRPLEKAAERPAPAARRPAPSKASKPRGSDNMYNVNSLDNHPQTAAQEAFLKQQSEQKLAPAIATGFVPPVIEEKVDDRPSPFKPVSPTPLNSADASGSSNVHTASSSEHVPPIALFTPIPVKEEAASPFKQIHGEEEEMAPGLKPPIKRPASASVNRAAAMQAESDRNQSALDKIHAAKSAAVGAGATDHDAVKAAEEAKKAAEEAARKARTTRPGADVNPFKPKYTPPPKTSGSASQNRPFNTAAAMKELRAMEEAEAAAEAEPKVVNGNSEGKRGGIPGIGRFFRNR